MCRAPLGNDVTDFSSRLGNFLVIAQTTGERLGIYNVCVLLITSK
jgi:hypothetical protein